MARLWGALLVTACMIAAAPPPQAVADGPTSVSIKAPPTVKPGATFTVRIMVTVGGPDQAYVTGGFMEFSGSNPTTSNSRCPATPVGTYAADTPRSPQDPGSYTTVLRVRNTVRRTGRIRVCVWVINARTGAQDGSGEAYIKAIAKKKPPRHHAKAALKTRAYRGRTAQRGLPIRFKIANREIRGLSYTANFKCSDGQTVLWGTRLPAFAFGADGRFDAMPPPIGTVDDAATIRGRVNGRRVTGSFSEQYTSVLGNTCQTGTVKFSATTPKKP